MRNLQLFEFCKTNPSNNTSPWLQYATLHAAVSEKAVWQVDAQGSRY